jgi:IS4 transposase
VLSDRCGYLTGCSKSKPPTERLREVVLRRENGEPLRLLTSLTDQTLSAEMIGELYRLRWKIELFFRWLKSCANFRHVISHSRNGLTAALYVALIATLLTAAATGRRPSKYALAALQFVAAGLAELEQMLPMLARFERERELARARREKKRAAK